jgi:hypothetical protein
MYFLDELIDEVQLGSSYSFSLIPLREAQTGQNSNQLNLVFEVSPNGQLSIILCLNPLWKFCIIIFLFISGK